MKTVTVIGRYGRLSMRLLVLAMIQQFLLPPGQAQAGTWGILPHELHSGQYSNSSSNDLIAFSHVINVEGFDRLRLRFEDYQLGRRSYVEVTSLLDRHQQRLHRVNLPR